MAILALNWRVWAVLGLLFTYALVRRLVRSWWARRQAPRGHPRAYGSNRP